nr:unnamed protein product [Callosobruchus chinensis]
MQFNGDIVREHTMTFNTYVIDIRARTYFSPSNLLTLYKAQIRPSLEYCSQIWGDAAPTTSSILDAVQRRAIRLIGDPALTCHLQPLSPRRAVAPVLYAIQQEVPKRALGSNAQPGSAKKSLIQAFRSQHYRKHDLDEQVSSIATAAGKKLGCLFRARKYFSPSNLLTLYKAQIRSSLENCSHI